MRLIDLETWVQRIADAVRAGHPDEDARVELKAEWPADTQRAARQLGAQANAAGGEPTLWIIGLDRTRGAVGAPYAELAGWWGAVRARFDDGVEPALLLNVNVPYEGVTLVGLLFETERAPYVLTLAPPVGSAQREVPWRGATGAASARRQDLLRMLAPMRALPEIETLRCTASAKQQERRPASGPSSTFAHWSFDWEIFVVPPRETTSSLVIHRSRLTLGYEDGGPLLMDRELSMMQHRAGVVHLHQPSFERSTHGVDTLESEVKPDTPLVATMTMAFAGSERPLVIRHRLVPVPRPNISLGSWNAFPDEASAVGR